MDRGFGTSSKEDTALHLAKLLLEKGADLDGSRLR
jgi:hypothetical protein